MSQRWKMMVLMDRCPLKISGKAKTNGLLYMQHIQRMEKGLGELKRLKHPCMRRSLHKYTAFISTAPCIWQIVTFISLRRVVQGEWGGRTVTRCRRDRRLFPHTLCLQRGHLFTHCFFDAYFDVCLNQWPVLRLVTCGGLCPFSTTENHVTVSACLL